MMRAIYPKSLYMTSTTLLCTPILEAEQGEPNSNGFLEIGFNLRFYLDILCRNFVMCVVVDTTKEGSTGNCC